MTPNEQKAMVVPCPLCGSDKLEGRGNRQDNRPLWIACTSCDATGPTILKNVEEDWNTRVQPAQQAGDGK